tara:strand:- start:918 stop:1388 length:471 start_codon:yes stop_codon:yes gene_type:complete
LDKLFFLFDQVIQSAIPCFEKFTTIESKYFARLLEFSNMVGARTKKDVIRIESMISIGAVRAQKRMEHVDIFDVIDRPLQMVRAEICHRCDKDARRQRYQEPCGGDNPSSKEATLIADHGVSGVGSQAKNLMPKFLESISNRSDVDPISTILSKEE